jgi:hypothetical protein
MQVLLSTRMKKNPTDVSYNMSYKYYFPSHICSKSLELIHTLLCADVS